jgi:hypothetical protein
VYLGVGGKTDSNGTSDILEEGQLSSSLATV